MSPFESEDSWESWPALFKNLYGPSAFATGVRSNDTIHCWAFHDSAGSVYYSPMESRQRDSSIHPTGSWRSWCDR